MKPEIYFEINDKNQLTVTIQTERLYMQSVVENDFTHYSQLFSDAENVAKFCYGKPWDAMGETKPCLDAWIKRWNHNDPFSALTVSKQDTGEFIGHIVLEPEEEPGHIEVGYAFDKKNWGKGYGKESVIAVVREYAPELINRNYKVNGEDFTAIVATARPDNEASVKILQAAGMKIVREEFKFAHNRYVFFVSTTELIPSQRESLVSIGVGPTSSAII
ncbi:GNAT family N-acetyltransferase [Rickettsiella endosymbiont of Dermanyssus gallinae]|uniref:GNAT family N-acetyltransferase n=1 Tax=Rickettsiella endosymbiont of Dermanyssus gallinae TaxID=2856608 RepID=UPI001C52CE41|nr:GNAT family N-acetyltransferase [Rickettsiella endosymbiont of Dermanyssus gallinae]